ncbi:hypothetical protein ACIQZI_13130 [Peribacillus sp. NPDC096379]|uniref:hypothetical protein n=1 Tax=Peribacillus sp. NPDC096379 TaxID=3364393 RepID=UPI00380EED77
MNDNTDKSNIGYTIFKPTGVRHEFPQIDLKTDTVQVQGVVDKLGNLSIDRDSYIDMFKQQARFFINNNISNPKKHYDELRNNQSF